MADNDRLEKDKAIGLEILRMFQSKDLSPMEAVFILRLVEHLIVNKLVLDMKI